MRLWIALRMVSGWGLGDGAMSRWWLVRCAISVLYLAGGAARGAVAAAKP